MDEDAGEVPGGGITTHHDVGGVVLIKVGVENRLADRTPARLLLKQVSAIEASRFPLPLRVTRLQPQCGHSAGGFAVAGLRAARRLGVQAGVSVEAGIRDEAGSLPRGRHDVTETGIRAPHGRTCGVTEKGWLARHENGRVAGDLGAGTHGLRGFGCARCCGGGCGG